jgi:elongation factor Ts
MADISATMVKELREKTGAGMMDCKKALVESAGDFTKAEEWLRIKGISKAAKKGDRIAAEGLVGVAVSADGQLGVVVEVNAETDFVARNDEFVKLTAGAVKHVSQHAPASVETMLTQPWEGGKTVKDHLTDKIATIGENITIRRFTRFQIEGAGTVGSYLHSNFRVGTMAEVLGSNGAEAKELAKELAMQIAAARPLYVSRDQIPADVLEKEKEISREELKAANKPEAIWDKILTGKLEKFYEGICLVDQLWIKEDKKKIKDVIAEFSKKSGTTLKVGRISRTEVGEGIVKVKDDLAAEVAKQLQS